MADKKQKAVASDVNFLLFGLFSLTADLVPARATESRSSLVSLCPSCSDPTRVKQFYSCDHEHGPFTQGDLVRKASEVNKALVELSADELASMKAPAKDEGAPQVTELAFYQADTLEEATRPGDLAYRLRPGKSTVVATYLGFRDIFRDRNVAVVCTVVIKGVERMYRLEVWGDQIFAQSLFYPEDLAERDVIAGTYDAATLATLVKDLLADVPAFDPSLYRNAKREQLEALLAAKAADPTSTVVVALAAPAAPAAPDLVAALQAMLAEKQALKEAS